MGGVGLEILFVSAILLLSLLLKALFGPKRTYMYYPPTNYFVWCKLVGWLVSGEPCFSKDGRSDISRILIPSPYPTAGLCPKTLHLDLAILPTEGDSIQVLPAALSFWKRERYRLSYWGRCGESIGHIVVQATTHWKEEPIVQVTSALWIENEREKMRGRYSMQSSQSWCGSQNTHAWTRVVRCDTNLFLFCLKLQSFPPVCLVHSLPPPPRSWSYWLPLLLLVPPPLPPQVCSVDRSQSWILGGRHSAEPPSCKKMLQFPRKNERDTLTDLRRYIVFLSNQCTMTHTVFAFHARLLRQSFCLFTPQKTVHWKLNNGPPTTTTTITTRRRTTLSSPWSVGCPADKNHPRMWNISKPDGQLLQVPVLPRHCCHEPHWVSTGGGRRKLGLVYLFQNRKVIKGQHLKFVGK